MIVNVGAESAPLKAFERYKAEVQTQIEVITGTLTTRSKAKAD